MPAIANSENTATTITTGISPNWAAGVSHFLKWETAITRSESGIEQRTSRRKAGRKTMEYFVDGLTPAEALDLFGTLDAMADGPLLVPWWPEGLRLSITMGSVTEAQVETEPLADWAGVGDKILIGDEIRTISAIAGRVLTLVADGGATTKAAGTWVFPMRLAAFDRPDQAAEIIRFDAAEQALRFIAL